MSSAAIKTMTISGKTIEFYKVRNKDLLRAVRLTMKASLGNGNIDKELAAANIMGSEEYEEIRDILLSSIIVPGIGDYKNYEKILDEIGLMADFELFNVAFELYLGKHFAELGEKENTSQSASMMTEQK